MAVDTAKLDAAVARVNGAVDRIAADLAALKDKVNQDEAALQAKLDAAGDAVNSAADKLDAADPVPVA